MIGTGQALAVDYLTATATPSLQASPVAPAKEPEEAKSTGLILCIDIHQVSVLASRSLHALKSDAGRRSTLRNVLAAKASQRRKGIRIRLGCQVADLGAL